MIKVGILNVAGYAGAELVRIIHNHENIQLTSCTGRSSAGKKLSDIYPHLRESDIAITTEIKKPVDFVFSALPHAASAEMLGPIIKNGIPVVDISADFRLKNLSIYEKWYKVKHPFPKLIESAVYGLPELHRKKIKKSKLVANPGCYPQGAILAMAPSVQAGLIENNIISDSKSGTSGAGRSGDIEYGFSELNNNMSAYGLSGHRHLPEICQELNALSHLAPMTRGILGTHYAKLKENIDQQKIDEIYRNFYKDEPFVSVVESPPATKQTWGSNNCLLYPKIFEESGYLVVVSALDNLVKGAAGTAIQNMNLMLGLKESYGLENLAVYP